MLAVAKIRAEPGIDLIETAERDPTPGEVKLAVRHGAICGTDLHIYNWDAWAAGRIEPPRVIGHEFCGEIVELGQGVTDREVGAFVASESHVIVAEDDLVREGMAHLSNNTEILGVDRDGGFAPFVCIPAENARPIPKGVPPPVASMLDALGNAVHTVMAGPIEGRRVLITGLGPIGLFAVAICKTLGAELIAATEVSDYRIGIAHKLGLDHVVNPKKGDADAALSELCTGGFHATLEMSGHPSSFGLAIRHTRPGGRVSLLGIYPSKLDAVDVNAAIFKGLQLEGIVGRRLWQTWDTMLDLLENHGLDVTPVITHRMPYAEADCAMRTLSSGMAGKVVLDF